MGDNPINLTDPSGEFAFIPLLLVGAAGGALGGLGYYAIRTALNPCVDWNWEEAIFWGGVGTGIGTILGSGIYGGWWIGVQAGWWGAAAGGGAGTSTLYRFANGTNDLTSRLSRIADPQLRAELQARIASMSPSELKALAEMHARGLVENSPFISTLSDIVAGAGTPDPWLHSIIHGSASSPAAQNLYQLSVPNNLLYYPTNALSQIEAEVLVLAETLMPYLIGTGPNPFAR